jgi:hypothetical protein
MRCVNRVSLGSRFGSPLTANAKIYMEHIVRTSGRLAGPGDVLLKRTQSAAMNSAVKMPSFAFSTRRTAKYQNFGTTHQRSSIQRPTKLSWGMSGWKVNRNTRLTDLSFIKANAHIAGCWSGELDSNG